MELGVPTLTFLLELLVKTVGSEKEAQACEFLRSENLIMEDSSSSTVTSLQQMLQELCKESKGDDNVAEKVAKLDVAVVIQLSQKMSKETILGDIISKHSGTLEFLDRFELFSLYKRTESMIDELRDSKEKGELSSQFSSLGLDGKKLMVELEPHDRAKVLELIDIVGSIGELRPDIPEKLFASPFWYRSDDELEHFFDLLVGSVYADYKKKVSYCRKLSTIAKKRLQSLTDKLLAMPLDEKPKLPLRDKTTPTDAVCAIMHFAKALRKKERQETDDEKRRFRVLGFSVYIIAAVIDSSLGKESLARFSAVKLLGEGSDNEEDYEDKVREHYRRDVLELLFGEEEGFPLGIWANIATHLWPQGTMDHLGTLFESPVRLDLIKLIPLYKITDKRLNTPESHILGNLLLINGPDEKHVRNSLQELKKNAAGDADKNDLHLDVSFADEVKGSIGITAKSILKHDGEWMEPLVFEQHRKREKKSDKEREKGEQVSEQKHHKEFAEALKDDIKEISCDSSQSGSRWKLGDFELVSYVGKGSYGIVWKVCLKEFPEFHFALKIEECTRHGFFDDFSRCLIYGSRLEHPNILPLLAFFSITESKLPSETFFMATVTPLGNQSLEAKLQSIGKKTQKKADNATEAESFEIVDSFVDTGVSLLEGVTEMHEQDIIHRDLKPDNILFFSAKDTDIKIADLGFVRENTRRPDESIRKATMCGTKGYMAPEISHTQAYTEKVDVYSCGIIFHEVRANSQRKVSLLVLYVFTNKNQILADGHWKDRRRAIEEHGRSF